MTDPTAAAPAAGDPPPAPVVVKDKAAAVVAPEALKAAVMIAAAFAVDHALRSDVTRTAALGAVAGLVGVIATFIWGVRQRVHTWRCMKFLANRLPDEVAIVGKPQ